MAAAVASERRKELTGDRPGPGPVSAGHGSQTCEAKIEGMPCREDVSTMELFRFWFV
jgi:hypothetical protein